MTGSRRTGMPGGGGGVRRRPEPVAHMATPGYALLFAITAGGDAQKNGCRISRI